MIRRSMWKRWLPILLVAEVLCLVVAAGWAVHRHASEKAPASRVTPAEWPYREAGSPASARIVAPPVPFRTDHPPAGAFNLRPIGPNDFTAPSRRGLEVRTLRASAPDDPPPDAQTLSPHEATVYYEPLRR